MYVYIHTVSQLLSSLCYTIVHVAWPHDIILFLSPFLLQLSNVQSQMQSKGGSETGTTIPESITPTGKFVVRICTCTYNNTEHCLDHVISRWPWAFLRMYGQHDLASSQADLIVLQ